MAKPFSYTQETARTCYRMAYALLPQYVYHQPEKVVLELSKRQMGVLFFFVLQCAIDKQEPDMEVVSEFSAHTGELDKEYDYYVVQYPSSPPPVSLPDFDRMDSKNILDKLEKIILAPYFSTMIMDKISKKVNYFILGQSPDGFTTFRTVTPQENANLGRGCEPKLESFLQLIRDRIRNFGFEELST